MKLWTDGRWTDAGVTGISSPMRVTKNIVFLSLKIDFVLANSEDPNEMLHFAAVHLGLHCFSKYLFMGFCSTKD